MSYKWKMNHKRESAILFDLITDGKKKSKKKKRELLTLNVGPRTTKLHKTAHFFLLPHPDAAVHQPIKKQRIRKDEVAKALQGIDKIPLEADGTLGWMFSLENASGWHSWTLFCSPRNVIFPTREGELITELEDFPYDSYRLSYPGTASTKCIVVVLQSNKIDPMENPHRGFVIGSRPSCDWAELDMSRREGKRFMFRFFQNKQELFVVPFEDNWKTGILRFRTLLAYAWEVENKKPTKKPGILKRPTEDEVEIAVEAAKEPRFFLQMGVRDFEGKVHSSIRNFFDLRRYIEEFRKIGTGHIVHLFGTNTLGFDCGFPDYRIDKDLGGKSALSKLVDTIHKQGLKASHHYNPRIAQIDWVDKRPQYRGACVLDHQGYPLIEYYKDNKYYVMNPSHDKWKKYCLDQIAYFKSIGFDYVQIDQLAYQRVVVTEGKSIGRGYQEMIKGAHRLEKASDERHLSIWVEGVSDVFDLLPGTKKAAKKGKEELPNFYQILPRDRYDFWTTGENRRGYPFGDSYPEFFTNLVPDVPVSMQVVTEKHDTRQSSVEEKMRQARRLNACVFDIELGFVNDKYLTLLQETVECIQKCYQKHGKPAYDR